MKESISRIREIACFAGVFLVVHFLIGFSFDQGALIDAPDEASRWSTVLHQLFRSVIVVAVATPIYVILMSMYGKHRARKARGSHREQNREQR